ncbi:MAG: S1 RNA-binding domain-containing protein [Lactobacillales bacterium]|jgi:predicted RNA-binding protein with RPS1 domain|nr:S1 RNA-binding domain-containing protein [Lactobacillales bacterium]
MKEIEKFEIGDVLDAKIDNIGQFGVFVFIDKIPGLVHISEVASHFVKDLNSLYKVGETIKVQVIDIDYEKEQLILSVRSLVEEPKSLGQRRYYYTKKNSKASFAPFEKLLPIWLKNKGN